MPHDGTMPQWCALNWHNLKKKLTFAASKSHLKCLASYHIILFPLRGPVDLTKFGLHKGIHYSHSLRAMPVFLLASLILLFEFLCPCLRATGHCKHVARVPAEWDEDDIWMQFARKLFHLFLNYVEKSIKQKALVKIGKIVKCFLINWNKDVEHDNMDSTCYSFFHEIRRYPQI